MVRPIMRDSLFLAQKPEPATEADKQVVRDHLEAGCMRKMKKVVGMWQRQAITIMTN